MNLLMSDAQLYLLLLMMIWRVLMDRILITKRYSILPKYTCESYVIQGHYNENFNACK